MSPYSDLTWTYLELLEAELWIARTFRVPLDRRALRQLLEVV
jgi:hypothetical protein